MNKILSHIFFAISLTCLSAIGAFAQEVDVPLIGVLEKTQKAERWLSNIASRTSMTREDLDEKSKQWVLSSTFITENVPPGRYRWVQENFDTPTKRRIEMVTIDGRRYRKVDKGPWEEVGLPTALNSSAGVSGGVSGGVSNGVSVGDRSAPRISSTARLIEQTTIDIRNVTVYEIRTVSTPAVDDLKVSSRTVRYWLRDDGMLLKKIEEFEAADKKPTRRVTTLYDYDNIKIDAPAVVKKENN